MRKIKYRKRKTKGNGDSTGYFVQWLQYKWCLENWIRHISRDMRFSTMWYVRPAKPQISLRIRAVWSELLIVAWIFYDVKLLTEHHLEILSLKGGCAGSSESSLVENATSLEITCRGSIFKMLEATVGSKKLRTVVNKQ